MNVEGERREDAKMVNDIYQAADLNIKIDGSTDNIPFDTFLKVMNGMSNVANEVDRTLSNNKRSVRWEVADLKHGSASLALRPISLQASQTRAELITNTIFRGIIAIQSRQQERPTGFSDDALKALRGVVYALQQKFTLTVGDDKSVVSVTTETVAQIDEWLAGKYEAAGSLEGRIEKVSIHGELLFTVYDRLEHRIECRFSPSQMKEVKEYLGETITIQGRISYRADGTPVSIKPDSIRPVVQTAGLPQPEDMFGVSDYGMRSEDYVRSLRDE